MKKIISLVLFLAIFLVGCSDYSVENYLPLKDGDHVVYAVESISERAVTNGERAKRID